MSRTLERAFSNRFEQVDCLNTWHLLVVDQPATNDQGCSSPSGVAMHCNLLAIHHGEVQSLEDLQ